MPVYEVRDPESGTTVELTGDSPPTEDEIMAVFAEVNAPSQTREVRGTAERETVMTPTFGVRDQFKGQGMAPFTESAEAKAAAMPEFKIPGVAAVTSSAEDQRDILKERGVDVRTEGGIHFVYQDGEPVGSINKPGIGSNDVVGFVADVASSIPAGRWASAGKTVLSRGMKALAGEAATTLGREAVGGMMGAEVDPVEVGVNAALAAGGETMVPIARFIRSKLTPQQASIALQSKGIDDLIEAGVPIEELTETLARNDQFMEFAGREAKLFEVGPDRVVNNLMASFRESPGATRAFSRMVKEVATEEQDKALAAFNGLSGMIEEGAAAERLAAASKELLDTKIGDGQRMVSSLYDKAWEGADEVNVQPLRQLATNLIENETLRSSVPERELKRLQEQLLPRGYESGPMTMEPQQLQKAIWAIRDAMIRPDGGVNASVKKTLAPLEKAIETSLNTATKGKYGQADEVFKRFKDDVAKLTGSAVGAAGKAKETTLGSLVNNIFSPNPSKHFASKRLMRGLAQESPETAQNLYGAHFRQKIMNIPEDASPSDIRKAIFGKTPDERKTVYALGEIVDPQIRKQLQGVEAVLKAQEGVENVLAEGADFADFARVVNTPQSHLLQPGLMLSTAAQRRIGKNLGRVYMAIATDPRWSKSWENILRKGRVSAKALKQQKGFERQAAGDLYQSVDELVEEVVLSLKGTDVAGTLAPAVATTIDERIEE